MRCFVFLGVRCRVFIGVRCRVCFSSRCAMSCFSLLGVRCRVFFSVCGVLFFSVCDVVSCAVIFGVARLCAWNTAKVPGEAPVPALSEARVPRPSSRPPDTNAMPSEDGPTRCDWRIHKFKLSYFTMVQRSDFRRCLAALFYVGPAAVHSGAAYASLLLLV